MKKPVVMVSLSLLVILSFLAGNWYQKNQVASGKNSRAILYYIDPMHPSYKSDKPGIAPDCGMKLEPVYADGTAGVHEDKNGQLPPGTVKIGPESQQLIGVKVGRVEKRSGKHVVRILGRIAVDETRIYRINATIDGWVTQTLPNATGMLVKKNETLGGFYSPEFLSAQQALIFALSSMDRVTRSDSETPGQAAQQTQFAINIRQYKDSLRNLGMGELQIEELIRTRQYSENVSITSPADGIILARGISQGQRFEKGTELYRIADLSRVWIMADIFENEAQFFKPGVNARVTLPNQNRTFMARVSSALPQFDAASRTLKLRLEADNPGFELKPDMFVDVELPVTYGLTLSVPDSAVIDSGLRKTVFVDRGNGTFEPRRVETGWRRNGLVEITRGLMDGERIVVAGTFLIDSESRMQAAAAGIYDNGVMDPVCGMYVDEGRARTTGRTSIVKGVTWFFCSPECKADFDKDPGHYGNAQVISQLTLSRATTSGTHHD